MSSTHPQPAEPVAKSATDAASDRAPDGQPSWAENPPRPAAVLPLALITALAVPLAVFLPPDLRHPELLVGACVLATGALAALAFAPWARLPSSVQLIPLLAYLGVVALLRDAEGGAASGYAPLSLLPLLWVAIYGARREIGMVVAGMFAVFAVPILAVGQPDYPVTEWRRAILFPLLGLVVGTAVHFLVRHLRNLLAERGRLLAQVEELARTDQVTGLPNRRWWDEELRRTVARARRETTPLCVALIDLDRFKEYNDAHGHAAGDSLLREAGEAWLEQLRESDMLARWGGDEFAVLLANCREREAAHVLDRVRLATPGEHTCSIGFAEWRPGESIEELLQRADAALYGEKARGRAAAVTPRRSDGRPHGAPRHTGLERTR